MAASRSPFPLTAKSNLNTFTKSSSKGVSNFHHRKGVDEHATTTETGTGNPETGTKAGTNTTETGTTTSKTQEIAFQFPLKPRRGAFPLNYLLAIRAMQAVLFRPSHGAVFLSIALDQIFIDP